VVRRRRLAAALAAMIVVLLATSAQAAPEGRYAGLTSQGRPVSLMISQGMVRNLKFVVDATCPSHHVWHVTASGFPPIRIDRSGFAETFSSTKPSATAKVKGSVRGKDVSGSLTIKRFVAREHHYCRGSATFSVHR
jgi:hypothetical protein